MQIYSQMPYQNWTLETKCRRLSDASHVHRAIGNWFAVNPRPLQEMFILAMYVFQVQIKGWWRTSVHFARTAEEPQSSPSTLKCHAAFSVHNLTEAHRSSNTFWSSIQEIRPGVHVRMPEAWKLYRLSLIHSLDQLNGEQWGLYMYRVRIA